MKSTNSTKTAQVTKPGRDKGKKIQLDILNYNCRGLANEERLCEFEEANDIKWDIVWLSEKTWKL